MATRRKTSGKRPAKSPAGKGRARAASEDLGRGRDREPVAKLRPGRPGELTPFLTKEICKDARLGMPQVRIAEFACIDPSTLSKWLDRGQREKSGPYRALWTEFRRAQGEAYREALRNVRTAAMEDPGFSKWWLSRVDPGFWGRRDNIGQADTSDRPEPGSVVAMVAQRLEMIAIKAKEAQEAMAPPAAAAEPVIAPPAPDDAKWTEESEEGDDAPGE